MDAKIPDDTSEVSNKAVNVGRRSLLGRGATGGIAVAAVGAMALLGPKEAKAITDTGSYFVYNAQTDFGATGNGTTDDTLALQNAINTASAASGGVGGRSNTFPLYIPPGTYKISTALTIPPFTVIFGAGRNLSTVIQPSGCQLFIIDGSNPSYGSWDPGIAIVDIFADLTNASTTTQYPAAVYINLAYNIIIRDCFFNNSGPNVACNTLIQNCNGVVLDNVSICGNSTTTASNQLGLDIVGTGNNFCSVKLIASDCEYFVVAMKTSGSGNSQVIVDMFSPYSESSGLNYYHGIVGGQVNIYGGEMLGGGGLINTNNCIYIAGNNLAIYGTYFFYPSVSVFGLANSPAYNNVKVFGYNSPPGGGGNPPTLVTGANLASIEFRPPLRTDLDRSTVHFTASVASGTSTNLLSLSTSGLMRCRVTICLMVGAATASAQFDFTIGSGGLIPNIAISAVSISYNGNWTAFWGSSPSVQPAPLLTAANSGGVYVYTFSLAAYAGGALGAGWNVGMLGEVEYTSYDRYAQNSVVALQPMTRLN